MKQVINENERLQLFALFTLANGYYRKLIEAEKAMQDILEHDDTYLDQLSDEIYDSNPDFDKALKNMGVTVYKDGK